MKKLDKRLLSENIDAAAKFDFDRKKVFCSAYYVYQTDNLETVKLYGTASLKGDKPLTENTIFRMASMTKPITAVATMLLVERGLLSVDDPVSKYIPEFADMKFIGRDEKPKCIPTIKHILTHSSGIPSPALTGDDNKTLANAVMPIINHGLEYEPGTKQSYSPTGAFDILAAIIERVTETDYASFLKKEIFIPCEMNDTGFIPTDEQKNRMVEIHNRVNDENTTEPQAEDCIFFTAPNTHFLGGAGLFSTLHDYSNFAKMLLNKGTFNGKRIIGEDVHKLMSTPQISKEVMPGNERWGLGVRVISETAYSSLPVGAYGWSGAYGTHFWVDPVNNTCTVFMKNSLIDMGGGNESACNFEKAFNASFEK